MGFFDFVKQGLGINSAQKALQTVGQYAPTPVIDNLLKTEQIIRNPPMLQLPRVEMPKYLPSTIRYFGNTLGNLPSMVAEQFVNTPSLLVKGVANTGLDLAGQINHGERVPLTKYVSDIAPFAEGMLNVATSGIGSSIAKNAIKSVAKPAVNQTISSMLKSTAKTGLKMAGEGGLIGGAYGTVQGLQAPNGDSVGKMIDNAYKSAVEGAKGGLVAGPVIGGSLKAFGKVYGSGKKVLDKMSPQEKQAGYIRLNGQVEPVKPPKEGYKRYEITVQGKKVYADVNPNMNGGHIEFQSEKGNPISETGYKSHFTPIPENMTVNDLQALGEQLAKENKPTKKSTSQPLLQQSLIDQPTKPIIVSKPMIEEKPKGNLEIPSMDKFLERSKKTLEPKIYAPEKVATPYKPTGNVQLNVRETQLADTLVKEMSLQGPKTFDNTKAHAYVEGIIKSLGVNKVEQIRIETLKYNKERGISKFHELVQQEIQNNEALAKNAERKTVTQILKKQVKPIVEPTKQTETVASKPNPRPWEDAGYILPEGHTPDTFSPPAYPRVKPKQSSIPAMKDAYSEIPLSNKKQKELFADRVKNTQEAADRSQAQVKAGEGDKLLTNLTSKKAIIRDEATKLIEPIAKIPKEKAWAVIDAVQNKETYNNASPEVKGYADQISVFIDKLYKNLTERGLKINKRELYMPGYWQDQPAGRGIKTLNPNTSRQKSKIYQSYAEGKAAGLKPLYDHPATIMERYITDTNNALANMEALNTAKKSGLVVPAYVGEAQKGFKRVDTIGFGTSEFKPSSGETYTGGWYGPKEFVDKLHKITVTPELTKGEIALQKTANAASAVQDVGLSGGIPYTPANFFTFTRSIFKELPATIRHPSRFVSVAKDFIDSFAPSGKRALDRFSKDQETIKEIHSTNTPFSSIYDAKHLIQKGTVDAYLGKNIGEWWSKVANEATFGRFIALRQLSFFKEVKADLMKRGYTSEQAIQIAGKALRNWEGIDTILQKALRDKNIDNAITTGFLAPKYREALLKFGTNTVQSVINPKTWKDPSYSANRNWIFGATAMTLIGEAINYKLNGHFTNENPPDTEGKILIPLNKVGGKEDDKTVIGIPTVWGSSLFAVPRSIVKAGGQLIKGDTSSAVRTGVVNNMSMLLRPLVDLSTNRNSFNSPIYNETDLPVEKLKKEGKYVAMNLPPLSHPFYGFYKASNANTSQESLSNISQALELPFRIYAQDKLDNKWYFRFVNAETAGMPKDVKTIWDKLHGADEKDINGNVIPNDRKKMSEAQDRLDNFEIVRIETSIAQKMAEKTGKPLSPFYQLPVDKQKTILTIATLPPGDADRSTITKANPWMKDYYAKSREYTKTMQSLGIFKPNPYYDENKVSDSLQEKLNAYGELQDKTGAKSAYLRANPDVLEYFQKNQELTNIRRAELGLPLIQPYGTGSSGKSKWKNYTAMNLAKKNKAANAKSVKNMFKKSKIKTPKYKSMKMKIVSPKKRKSLKAILVKPPNYKAI